jgi:ribosomal protein S18 acetylase RimI-like enzyme
MSTESRHLVGPARRQTEPGVDARSPTAGDAEALAVLMLDAYRGTVDADGSETIGMARREVNGYLAGESGPPRLDVSRVVEQDGHLAAAVLVSDYEELPLIAYVMTSSGHKRRGLATALMCEVLSALADAGEPEAHLWVTSANPAVRIYERLGFHDRADPPEG